MDTRDLDKKPPRPAGDGPVTLDLEPGQYKWCACGYSINQPWCDHAHRESGTGLKSIRFEVKEKSTRSLCLCKRTRTPPDCDGSHLITE